MTIAEFRASPPDELDGPLLALWWAAEDNWDKAHEIAQDIEGAEGAWVHAYLHRKEGDLEQRGLLVRRGGTVPPQRETSRPSGIELSNELLARR